ncbi:hydantoinase/oxoprolinase family protein [Candidatus Bipolaricaulota bacterium]
MASAIGIDIGGTFIDLVIAEEAGIRYVKVPSTPDAPAEGVLNGLKRLVQTGEIVTRDVRRVIHGSTVATNALLEGSWGQTALVTTRGFRDVLEIGRQDRPRLYDLFYERPPPIVPRDLRFEVTERLSANGSVHVPLARKEVEDLIPILREAEIDAVAVVFLFSFLDPGHEREVKRILSSALRVPVVISCEVLPEFREYERTSTTVVTAALRPIVGDYVTRLEDGGKALGLPERWQIMQSSGAVTSAEIAEQEPARVVLSGPAGGVEGARAIGEAIGERNLITMDMGGTSCDVALVRDGRVGWSTRGKIGGHPIALPMIEIHTIGAGGGSIAWVDSGGALRVGPESAGATPGPACYGRGGERPTVTDAHVVLGHLIPDRAIGGLPALSMERAADAVREIAQPLRVTLEEGALGILEVSDAAMERAIRVISVERGEDPRNLSLLAFGGAGPLHAVSVARRLSVPRVIIPAGAGVLSAFGLLCAEAGHDYSRGVVRPFGAVDPGMIAEIVAELSEAGRKTLCREGLREAEIRFRVSLDLRYVGQSHELNVEISPANSFSNDTTAAAAASFHELHGERFGHATVEGEIELIAVRVRAFSPAEPLVPSREAEASGWEDQEGEAWFDGSGPTRTRFRGRGRIDPDEMLEGPLVVVGTESTILVPVGSHGRRDSFGNLVLEVERL